MTGPRRGLGPGDVIRAEEPDYCYGVGPIILRLVSVGRVEHHRDGAWLNVEGVVLRRDGSVFHPQPRHALVRMSGIRRIRQPEAPS